MSDKGEAGARPEGRQKRRQGAGARIDFFVKAPGGAPGARAVAFMPAEAARAISAAAATLAALGKRGPLAAGGPGSTVLAVRCGAQRDELPGYPAAAEAEVFFEGGVALYRLRWESGGDARGPRTMVMDPPRTVDSLSAAAPPRARLSAYLAGPDVFLPGPAAHAARKVEICARYGIEGRPPLNDDIAGSLLLPPDEAWRAIFLKDMEMMQAADVCIANLTPFRGLSADPGTVLELGWFLGRGRPAYAYTNCADDFEARQRARGDDGMAVEGFGCFDNLMLPGALEYGRGGLPVFGPEERAWGRGTPEELADLRQFERCVAAVAARHRAVRPAGLAGETAST